MAPSGGQAAKFGAWRLGIIESGLHLGNKVQTALDHRDNKRGVTPLQFLKD